MCINLYHVTKLEKMHIMKKMRRNHGHKNRRFHTIWMFLWKYVSEYFTSDLKRDFMCKIWNLFEMG